MVTGMTESERLAALESRVDEHSAALQDIREQLRAMNARIDAMSDSFNARMDRMFLAILAMGAAQIGLLVTLIIRS